MMKISWTREQTDRLDLQNQMQVFKKEMKQTCLSQLKRQKTRMQRNISNTNR